VINASNISVSTVYGAVQSAKNL